MARRNIQVIWLVAIVFWVVICSAGWVVATRSDYARLHTAVTCTRAEPKPAVPDPRCASVKPSDVFTAKAEIDRKARISRLAAAFGTAGAFAVWFLLGRPGLDRER